MPSITTNNRPRSDPDQFPHDRCRKTGLGGKPCFEKKGRPRSCEGVRCRFYQGGRTPRLVHDHISPVSIIMLWFRQGLSTLAPPAQGTALVRREAMLRTPSPIRPGKMRTIIEDDGQQTSEREPKQDHARDGHLGQRDLAEVTSGSPKASSSRKSKHGDDMNVPIEHCFDCKIRG
jgi:hypothetical protein